MTFNNVIEQLKKDIEYFKSRLEDAQNPFNDLSDKPYFHIMGQVLAKRALDKAEDDTQFFIEFLDEYHIDKNLETDGLEVLILKLDRIPKKR